MTYGTQFYIYSTRQPLFFVLAQPSFEYLVTLHYLLFISGVVGEGSEGRESGGGDTGVHVRDLAGVGSNKVGRGDLREGGQGILQVLAEYPEEFHGEEVK